MRRFRAVFSMAVLLLLATLCRPLKSHALDSTLPDPTLEVTPGHSGPAIHARTAPWITTPTSANTALAGGPGNWQALEAPSPAFAGTANTTTTASLATQPVSPEILAAAMIAHVQPARPTAQQLGQKHRVLSAPFLVLAGLSLAATVADIEATAHCPASQGCHGLNLMFGPDPSRGRMYGIGIPVWSVQTGLSGWLKHKYPKSKTWAVSPIVNTLAHGITAGFNASR